MILQVKKGTFSYDKRKILKDISFDLKEEEVMSILGPNGVGKTTLLRCLMGFLKWDMGKALLFGKDINKYAEKELWENLSYVPQVKKSVFSYGVLEMVVMGLDKENSFFHIPTKEDYDKAYETLKELGVEKLSNRYCDELSGGELQMVMIARALVSNPKLLILDEPESNLDMKNQIRIIEAIKHINVNKKSACIINTHFPSHALQISDKTLFIGSDYKTTFDESSKAITEDNLQKYFQIKAKILIFQAEEVEYKTVAPYKTI